MKIHFLLISLFLFSQNIFAKEVTERETLGFGLYSLSKKVSGYKAQAFCDDNDELASAGCEARLTSMLLYKSIPIVENGNIGHSCAYSISKNDSYDDYAATTVKLICRIK